MVTQAIISGIAAADLDGDGLLELFVSHTLHRDRTFSIFEETRNDSNNWIRVFPLTKFGAPARGAMVTVTLSDFSKRSVVIGADCSYKCQSEPVAHFGLGKTFAKVIIIAWPDGHQIKVYLTQHDVRHVLLVTYYGRKEYLTKFSNNTEVNRARRTTFVYDIFTSIAFSVGVTFCTLAISNIVVT